MVSKKSCGDGGVVGSDMGAINGRQSIAWCRCQSRKISRLEFAVTRAANVAVMRHMKVERVKYVIWAADMRRAVQFYVNVFGGKVVKQNEFISEVAVCESTIGIHGGGEGNRTWTGLSFQVPDVVAGTA